MLINFIENTLLFKLFYKIINLFLISVVLLYYTLYILSVSVYTRLINIMLLYYLL